MGAIHDEVYVAWPALPEKRAGASSLGRFLESNFYNTVATTRLPGCPHSLHLHHERYVGCGSLVCSMRFQQSSHFSKSPSSSPVSGEASRFASSSMDYR